MDFSYNINELFKEEITIVDSNLKPCQEGALGRERFHQLHNKMFEIVDKMGEASAKAQGLHHPVTTATKLKSSDHSLYIMKDSNGNSGKGSIVGILKMGRKKLFVYDKANALHEILPLCVLDFYIHESRQRMGCGRKLFEFMLRREDVLIQHLAIDTPSPKFLSFAAKHYNLRSVIPQVNSFVIFDGFFYNRSDLGNNQNKRQGAGYHDGHNSWPSQQRPGSGWRHSSAQQLERDIAKNAQNNWSTPNSLRQHQGNMGASELMYSRHGVVASGCHNERPLSTRNCYRQDPISANNNANYNKISGHESTHKFHNSNFAATQKCLNQDLLPPKQFNQTPNGHSTSVSSNLLGSSSSPNFENHIQNGLHSPVLRDVDYPQYTIQTSPSFQLPDISANQQLVQQPPLLGSIGLSHQPLNELPGYSNKELHSSLLEQDGRSSNYKDLLNLQQKHQQRNGHQTVIARSPTVFVPETFTQQNKQMPFGGQDNRAPYDQSSNNSSWTVMGVLRDQRLNTLKSPGHTNRRFLW